MNLRRFQNRVINYLRPKPRMIPLRVEEVLASSQGREIVERFNDFYYSSGAAGYLKWRGTQVLKNPCDVWAMVELFQDIHPSLLIETGTHHGGSARLYADMLRLLEIRCKIVTIDMNPKIDFDLEPLNITSLRGYSTDADIVQKVRQFADQYHGAVIVALDSDHSEGNVSKELTLYSPFVTPGSYLVVEDTNINGHPSLPSHGPGPWEAVEKFLAATTEFQVDLNCQRFLLTFNPRGWLKRVRPVAGA